MLNKINEIKMLKLSAFSLYPLGKNKIKNIINETRSINNVMIDLLFVGLKNEVLYAIKQESKYDKTNTTVKFK